MPKLSADTYVIKSKPDGRSAIEFKGPDGRVFEIEIPSIALMGLAHKIREAAHLTSLPLQHNQTSGRMRLYGPPMPKLLDQSATLHEGLQYTVSISADFETISLDFTFPGEGAERGGFTCDLPLTDAEGLFESLRVAIALSKTRPSAGKAKH